MTDSTCSRVRCCSCSSSCCVAVVKRLLVAAAAAVVVVVVVVLDDLFGRESRSPGLEMTEGGRFSQLSPNLGRYR